MRAVMALDGEDRKSTLIILKTIIEFYIKACDTYVLQAFLLPFIAVQKVLLQIERGDGIIFTNSHNGTVEFRTSEFETELITTDRAELQFMLKRRRDMAQ